MKGIKVEQNIVLLVPLSWPKIDESILIHKF